MLLMVSFLALLATFRHLSLVKFVKGIKWTVIRKEIRLRYKLYKNIGQKPGASTTSIVSIFKFQYFVFRSSFPPFSDNPTYFFKHLTIPIFLKNTEFQLHFFKVFLFHFFLRFFAVISNLFTLYYLWTYICYLLLLILLVDYIFHMSLISTVSYSLLASECFVSFIKTSFS